ncbi:hypothetical protein AYI69_g3773 [Smittium culicis]|uniref:CCHC-type domain-containing protein n=1 Tax=Smittium culicis TaxID=133412 RepID=A0A1R1YIS9_9FUNG|nr:hypothetical protein AYI69_g3773 [Smittium culicis]
MSAAISFEGLPPRFRGDSKDLDPVEIWSRKFKSIAHLKGWEEKQSIEVFKVWLEGPVAVCEEIPESLDKLIEELSAEFGIKKRMLKDRAYDIFSLSQFSKKDDESIEKFNDRFTNYLAKIEKRKYTKESINEIYKRIIKNIDSEIWWEIIKDDSSQIIDYTMTRVEDFYLKKHGNSKPKEMKSDVIKKEVKISKNKDGVPENQMSKVIEMMENLTLMVSNQIKPKFDPSKIKCFNCGILGHATKFCNEPRNVENRMKNYCDMHRNKMEEDGSLETRDRPVEPEEKTMYLSSETKNDDIIFLTDYTREETFVITVSGDSLLVVGSAIINLHFDDEAIAVKFQVLETCAVPIIFGLDVCQSLNAIVNYNKEKVTLINKNDELILQLYTKENLPKTSDEDDQSDVESINNSEGHSDVEEYEEGIFLALEIAEISGAGKMPAIKKNEDNGKEHF